MPLVIMNQELLDILQAKRTMFQSQEMAIYLYTNNITPNPGNVPLDFTPATFNGAGGKNIVWSADPVLLAGGQAVLIADTVIWNPVAPFIPETCYGWYVLGADPLRVCMAERFETGSVVIGGNTNPYAVSPQFREKSIQP